MCLRAKPRVAPSCAQTSRASDEPDERIADVNRGVGTTLETLLHSTRHLTVSQTADVFRAVSPLGSGSGKRRPAQNLS